MAERQVDPEGFGADYFRTAGESIIADIWRVIGGKGIRPPHCTVHAWAFQTSSRTYLLCHIARHNWSNHSSVEAWVEEVDCGAETDMFLREHAERKVARLAAMYAGGHWGV